MMKLCHLAGSPLFTWAAAFALLSYSSDALSINTVPSTKGLTLSSIVRGHRRRGERPFDTSLNFSSNIDEDESLMHEDCHHHLTRDKYLLSTDCNSNDDQLSRWNEIAQTFTSVEERGRNNFNKALSVAMMSMAIGMQPLLPAYAHEYSITNIEQGATTTTIQSSSILTSSSTSSELRVKIDDTIATRKISQSNPSKLSMGVKIEYTPEEIEMSIQAEKEQLERMAQVEKEEQLVVEKDQKLVDQKVEVETPKVATTETTKSVEQSQPQQFPPPTSPQVQIEKNVEQQQQSPPPIINTEKDELIKILKDTSKTSKMTKQQTLPSISPIVGQPVKNNDVAVMTNELDEEQLQLIQLVGIGAVGAGLFNSLTSKKGDESDVIVNNDIEESPMPTLSNAESSPPPLEQFKPIPPITPPTYPTEMKLKKALGLLEDDLQELNKNLELLENDLYELNDDLDSLQDDEEDNSMPSTSTAPTVTAISTASYLESLASGSQFESNRSGEGFQSSYLGSLGGAAPLEFDYEEDSASSMVQDNVDQGSYSSSVRDQVEMEVVEESKSSPPPVPSPDGTSPNAVNAQRQIIETKSGRRLSINADIVSDVNIDRPGQSSTRLQMFGMNYPRGRCSTRLYMSPNFDEEESLFPSTDALIEVLRQKKMEKDRRDAELRAQQQADVEAAMMARQEEELRVLAEQQALQLEEQRVAAEVQRVREETEQRAREEQDRRILQEQRAKEEAAQEMEMQMRMMAAEKKAEEEAIMEKFLLDQKTREEEAERRRQQEETERLAAAQRAKEEAELKARHEMRMKQEAEDLIQIERSMSYLNDAMAQVDDRLDALSNGADGANLDIDDGIQYLNSAVSEIDSLLSEDGG